MYALDQPATHDHSLTVRSDIGWRPIAHALDMQARSPVSRFSLIVPTGSFEPTELSDLRV